MTVKKFFGSQNFLSDTRNRTVYRGIFSSRHSLNICSCASGKGGDDTVRVISGRTSDADARRNTFRVAERFGGSDTVRRYGFYSNVPRYRKDDVIFILFYFI